MSSRNDVKILKEALGVKLTRHVKPDGTGFWYTVGGDIPIRESFHQELASAEKAFDDSVDYVRKALHFR